MYITLDTSNFKPISYSEMIAPMILYNKDYDEYLDKFEKIAEDYSNLLSAGLNRQYQEQLNLFNQSLADAQEAFYSLPLSKSGRLLHKVFLDSKRIASPIKKGIEEYNKDVDKVTALGTDAILSNDLNVNDYIGGTKKPIKYMSRKDALTTSAATFKGMNEIAKLKLNPEFLKIASGYLMSVYNGINPEQAMLDAFSNMQSTMSSEEMSELLKAMHSVATSLGVDNSWSDNARRQVYNTVGLGLLSSITDDRKMIEDKGLSQALQSLEYNKAKANWDIMKDLYADPEYAAALKKSALREAAEGSHSSNTKREDPEKTAREQLKNLYEIIQDTDGILYVKTDSHEGAKYGYKKYTWKWDSQSGYYRYTLDDELKYMDNIEAKKYNIVKQPTIPSNMPSSIIDPEYLKIISNPTIDIPKNLSLIETTSTWLQQLSKAIQDSIPGGNREDKVSGDGDL